jgi:hypothetical protein
MANILLSLMGPTDWIFICGEKHQRLGDKAAGTIVIPAAQRSEVTRRPSGCVGPDRVEGEEHLS